MGIFFGGVGGEEDTASLTEPKGRSTAGIPRGQDQRPESHQQTAVSEVSLLPFASFSFILSAEQHPLLPSPVAHQDGPQQPLIPETTSANGLSVHPRTSSRERRSWPSSASDWFSWVRWTYTSGPISCDL